MVRGVKKGFAKDQEPGTWGKMHPIGVEHEPRPILKEISVVIPTLGRDILQQCLYRLFSGSAWPGCLIVVNQGPKERVEDWLQAPRSTGINVKHVCSDQRGRSAGLNRGLEQVETAFVAITDDDCFVDGDWLMNMASKVKQNPEAIVTGRVEASGDDVIIVVTSTLSAEYRKPRLKFDSMSGGNMGTSISVIRKAGLFDEDPCMQTAEDAEFSYRALRKNIPIIYEPNICLWHFGWRDLGKRREQYRHYALSHGGFYGKYLRKGDFFILARAGLHLVRALRRWLLGFGAGDEDRKLMGRAYSLYLLPGILMGVRSRIHPGRLA
jgi:GT2 family glycosyltransferase